MSDSYAVKFILADEVRSIVAPAIKESRHHESCESDESFGGKRPNFLSSSILGLQEQGAKLLGKSGQSRQIVEGDRGKARQRVRKALKLVIEKVKSQDDATGAALAEALDEDVRANQFFIGQLKSKQPFTDRLVSSFSSEEQGSERTGSGRGHGRNAFF